MTDYREIIRLNRLEYFMYNKPFSLYKKHQRWMTDAISFAVNWKVTND